MNCDEARDTLLDAELPLANDAGNSALVMHLNGCANCSALAAALENQLVTLRADYTGMQSHMSAGELATAVLDQTRVRTVQQAPARGNELRGSMIQAGRKRRGIAATALLGAAIAAAITIFVMNRDAPEGGAASDPLSSAQHVPIQVEVPANQNAIVFETRNPNITVVWLYSGD